MNWEFGDNVFVPQERSVDLESVFLGLGPASWVESDKEGTDKEVHIYKHQLRISYNS